MLSNDACDAVGTTKYWPSEAMKEKVKKEVKTGRGKTKKVKK